jgi:hypothetical protein
MSAYIWSLWSNSPLDDWNLSITKKIVNAPTWCKLYSKPKFMMDDVGEERCFICVAIDCIHAHQHNS